MKSPTKVPHPDPITDSPEPNRLQLNLQQSSPIDQSSSKTKLEDLDINDEKKVQFKDDSDA